MNKMLARAGAAGLCLFATLANAAAFTPGNVVVYRVGTSGGPALGTGAAPVFLDEIAVPGGGVVNSVALPTSLAGANRPLVASGTSATDGMLARSANGNCIAVPGYGRDVSVTGGIVTAAGVPRIAGRVNALGAVDTTTAIGDFTGAATNFRGIASADCASFWLAAGTGGGIRYATLGAATSLDVTNGTFTSMRALGIFDGQLYVSTPLSSARPIATVGSGLPTTSPQSVARVAGLAPAVDGAGFFFADLDAGVAGVDTVYISDDTTGVITKLSKVGATWSSNGSIGGGTDLYRGLTGKAAAGKVTLFSSRNANAVVMIADANGYNAPFAPTTTVLQAAVGNTAYRGVALAPEVTVTPSAGPHGSISPAVAQVVAGGARPQFVVTPDPGYSVVVGGTCVGGMIDANTFKTDPVSANCTVVATFTLIPTFTATPLAGAHGTITPSAAQTLQVGTTTSFTITPDAGYAFQQDGTCPGTLAGNVFTLAPIAADCTLTASFTLITFTVTPSAGAGGAIDPSSPVTAPLGARPVFTVTPAHGFAASVDGSCGGSLTGSQYTTLPLTADCSVAASFTPLPRYAVTPTANAHGTMTPLTSQTVIAGDTASFTIVPDAGYNAAVRGTCGGTFSGNVFTTAAVAGDCTLSVTFAQKLVLFVGNSYTFGRVDPVMSYNAANVSDLTLAMWVANADGTNADEPHPWGGIPGVFKKLADQAGLDWDVSISARNAASLRGHYLNTNPAGWDLRGNIASQRWDIVVMQDLSDEPLPPGRGANADLPYFDAYVDKIEAWIHQGLSESYTETQLFGGTTAACRAATGASASACDALRVVPNGNPNARASAEVYLYETWARPDMIAPNGTNASGTFYTAAEGLEAMTADFHNAYFGRAAANGRIEDVAAVGDAFLRAVHDGYAMRDPYVPEAGKINLWHTDFFHPSKYGSYLSALVHFATLTGMSPMMFGAGDLAAADLGIAPDAAMQLQRVARETVMPDTAAPVSTASVSEAPNAAGWNNHDVVVTFTATDAGWGVDSIHYTLAGTHAGSGTLASGGTLTIATEGVTTITFYAVDIAGNREDAHTLAIALDKTAPVISGMPTGCSLWPPNHKMVQVATVSASGGASGLASFSVVATSSEPAAPGESDTSITGSGIAPRGVSVRADRNGAGPGRTYTIVATASDAAGNNASATATCVVPHDKGK